MESSGGYVEYAFVADYYDHVVPYRNRPDVTFYVETAVESGGPVLELGCGTGRVTIPTALAGIGIVGIDLSPHMLDVCRTRLRGESPEVNSLVELLQLDMRGFDLNRGFSLVTTPFRSFQHLITVEDQVSCLDCAYRHLEPGGQIILDIFNPSLEALTRNTLGEEIGEEPEFRMQDGRRVSRRHKIVDRDPFNQINQVELIYYVTHPDGREERLVHSFPMRYLFRYEAQHLLERCGFEFEEVFADFEKSPYGSKSPGELICVARKAGA